MQPSPPSSRIDHASLQVQRVEREDLLMFINACFACTGQREFYSDGRGQSVSIDFLHRYILGNYRVLYARTLACSVNHFNQALIVQHLLQSGKDTAPAQRAEENALITRALAKLPAHRALHLLERLAKLGVNNRRTRAITRTYLSRPRDREFRAVKYRRSFRKAAIHVHLPFEGELGPFFVRGWRERNFKTKLFEAFRQAHFSAAAVYALPFTIAEGFAHKLRIPRAVFLKGIEPQLTAHERMRLQNASKAGLHASYSLDAAQLPPTRLATYIISEGPKLAKDAVRRQELHQLLEQASSHAAQKADIRLPKIACVLDRSFSSSGSTEKRKRPLAVALATSFYLRAIAREYQAFWTHPTDDELLVQPRGPTDLATPILDALDTQPDVLLIVSDGFDNDPPGVAGQVLEIAQLLAHKRGSGPFLVHLNPVYDSEGFAPKSLSPDIPTMGIRDAEDIPTLLLFARFASSNASLPELLEHLETRVQAFLSGEPVRANGLSDLSVIQDAAAEMESEGAQGEDAGDDEFEVVE
jgi:hypothetical protein